MVKQVFKKKTGGRRRRITRRKQTNLKDRNRLMILKKKYNVKGKSNLDVLKNLYKIKDNLTLKDLHKLSKFSELNHKYKINILNILKKNVEKSTEADLKGLWKSNVKSYGTMTKQQYINEINKFRKTWQELSSRKLISGTKPLKDLDIRILQKMFKYYFSNECKELAYYHINIGESPRGGMRSRNNMFPDNQWWGRGKLYYY